MTVQRLILYIAGASVLAALVVTAFLTRGYWYDPLLQWAARGQKPAEEAEEPAHASQDRLRLSPQALASLDLDVQPVELRPSYWKSIDVPGQFTERPGRSDRGLTSPLPGVVTEVLAVPGEAVKAGQKLFTIQVISEELQNSQRELYQVLQNQAINRAEKSRLEKVSKVIPQEQLLELDYEYRRLQGREASYRSDLRARGLSEKEIKDIAEGTFVKTITLHAPTPSDRKTDKAESETAGSASETPPYGELFDVETLEVHPGDQVEAGEKLCILSEHNILFLEGRVFKHEISLVQKAMEEEWPLEMQLVEPEKRAWPRLTTPLKILYIGNEVDPDSQTVPVFVPVRNDYIKRTEGDKLFRTWRFRPAQRVFLRIPVEHYKNVLVLPTDAVVREGVENYVFQQNGNAFDRKEVQVLNRDQHDVVIVDDGVLIPGISYVAHRGASQLQRALLIQQSSGKIDPHAGHVH
jgi:multidrug efflux pump subunit AcrA (membrane-fusion protein)